MAPVDTLLLVAALLLTLSILASKVSVRLGVPALILFLAIGMLAGSDGPGGIHFDDPHLAQSLGVVALSFILFSGGLDTQWTRIRSILRQGMILSTMGVVISTVLVGAFAVVTLGFSWVEGLLLGAIVSSTDAAAVFSILRSKKVGLKEPIRPLLELESGSNDPMAVFLTIGLVGLLSEPASSPWSLLWLLIRQMALGAVMGYAWGRFFVFVLKRLRLEYEGLYPVLSLAFVLLAYSGTSTLGGNGFLSVYLMGLIAGNSRFIHQKSLLRFHDGLAWLMQIIMFLALGLLVFPSRLPAVAGSALAVSFFLIFAARPASVFASLAGSGLSIRQKVMIAWVGLRGAVPIILATFPLVAGIPKADLLFNMVFFIVLTSSLIQGGTIPFVARALRVEAPLERRRPMSLEFEPMEGSCASLEEFVIPYESETCGKRVMDLNLPQDSLIALICRNDQYLVPNGQTQLEGGDVVLTLVNEENRLEAGKILSS